MDSGTLSLEHLSWFDAAARDYRAGFLRADDRHRRAGLSRVRSGVSPHPAKVASGIVTGIGFLGAGAIFREQQVVPDAGSVAAIWGGATGIVCGLDLMWLAGLFVAGVILTLLRSHPFIDDDTVSAKVEDEGEI